MVLKWLIYLYNKQMKCLGQFSGGNGKKRVKATWNSFVRAVKASGQSGNILSIYDEMVLKWLIYLYNKQMKCLGQV